MYECGKINIICLAEIGGKVYYEIKEELSTNIHRSKIIEKAKE